MKVSLSVVLLIVGMVLPRPAAGREPDADANADTPLLIRDGLVVESLGKRYTPDPRRVIVSQDQADQGGSTSVRNTDADYLVWKPAGYFQRNRDLGQVFTAPHDVQLDAIVVRTGPSDAAVGFGAPGAPVFVQFCEVVGSPVLDENGTPFGTDAKHGFSTNHRCDDVLRGVQYRPIQVVLGGTFPDLSPTRDSSGKPTTELAGRLTYLRWQLIGAARPRLAAGKRYAFVLGFEEAAKERYFTLANANAAGVNAPARLGDDHDRYRDGWAVRREGDGSCPPTMISGLAPPRDPTLFGQLLREALFPENPRRFCLSPTTDGYPDVDTYRDLEFYLESNSSDCNKIFR